MCSCEWRRGRGELGRTQGRIPAAMEGWSLATGHKGHCKSIGHTYFCPIKQHGVWGICSQVDYKLLKKTKQTSMFHFCGGLLIVSHGGYTVFCKPVNSIRTSILVWLWWEPSLRGGSVSLSLTEVGLEWHPYSCACFTSTSFIPHQPWPSATRICFHELSDCVEHRNEKVLALFLLSTGIILMRSLHLF